jgi:hypothetical protein
MSLTTEIEKTERGLSLEKRCWLNSNWNTIRLLDHNWSCRIGFRSGLYGFKS